MIARSTVVSICAVVGLGLVSPDASAQQVTWSCGSGTNGPCVSGNNSVGIAVAGTSTSTGTFAIGVEGASGGSGGTGVFGSANSGTGVAGASSTGVGVSGTSTSGNGMEGWSYSSGNGVAGHTYNSGTSGVYGESDVSGGGGYGVAGRAAGSGTAVYGDNTNSSGWSGYFTGKVYAGSGYSSSDIRLKKDVRPLEGAVEQVLRLHGVTFEWKAPEERGEGVQIGFIAQDVEKVFPQWVTTDPSGFKAVNTKGVEGLLVESVRALKSDNDMLRAKSTDLDARLRQLEASRHPLMSGFGEGGIGFGLVALAGAVMITRRKRLES